jgi:hypothetical protein
MSDLGTKKLLADESAADDYALYQKTKDGALIWKIYRLYRKLGLAVPDYILDKLDSYAEGIVAGEDALTTLELKGRRFRSENERDIVLMYHVLRGYHAPMEAARMTAEHFGRSVEQVKVLFSKWTSTESKESDKTENIINTQALINSLFGR